MNLENLGVQEMNANELVSVDGGNITWMLYEPVISWAASEFVDGFVEGFTQGVNAVVDSHMEMYH